MAARRSAIRRRASPRSRAAISRRDSPARLLAFGSSASSSTRSRRPPRRPRRQRAHQRGSIAGISSGGGSSASATSAGAASRRALARRVRLALATTRARQAARRVAARRCIRIGFQRERRRGQRADAASATTSHAPDVAEPGAPVEGDECCPRCPPREYVTPRAGSTRERRRATGSSTTTPAKKIIHERSVSDSSRPNSAKRMHRGSERNERGRRPADEADQRIARGSRPTGPTLSRHVDADRDSARARATRARPREIPRTGAARCR